MSNKERIIQLIENVPEHKLTFIVNMLENIKGYAGEAISIEDLAKELDIKL